jgi:hypothetical protein
MNLAVNDEENAPFSVRLIEVETDGIAVIEAEGQELRLWNHEPERLMEALMAAGGIISYQPKWRLLWIPSDEGRFAFSVAGPPDNHVPCPVVPPSGSPMELLQEAGGFTLQIGNAETEEEKFPARLSRMRLPGTRQEARVPFAEVNRDLSDLAERMLRTPGRWVLVLEVEDVPMHYTQLWTDHDDNVILAECVSNEFLEGPSRLTDEQEELLPTLGWDWPAPPNQPNWRSIDFQNDAALGAAILVAHTMRKVFGCTDQDDIIVRLFPGKPRGADGPISGPEN